MLCEDHFQPRAGDQASDVVVVLAGLVSRRVLLCEFSEILFCENLRLSCPLARFLVIGAAADYCKT